MKTVFLFLIFCFCLQISWAQSTLIESFLFEGKMRTYRLYLPTHYVKGTFRPLVVDFHPYTGNAIDYQNFSNWKSVADTANFLIAFPNGLIDDKGNQYWNAGFFGEPATNDVGFASALMDTIFVRHTIDRNKVYTCGLSNGGFFSYILAAELSNKITAIASVSGGMVRSVADTIKLRRAIPTLEIHDTGDQLVPYLGNTGKFGFINSDTLTRVFAKNNRCSLTPHITELPDINKSDGTTVSLIEYTGGIKNTANRLYRINGGGHADWPGNGAGGNMDFNACAEIWKFFRQYKLSDFTGIVVPDRMNPDNLVVFPQPASNQVTLSFNNFGGHHLQLLISIVTPTGQVVKNYPAKSVNTESPSIKLDISDLPKGFYVLEVSDGMERSACKFLKE